MPTSQYSSSFGRLQALSVNFLSPAFMQDLLKAKDVFEMAKMLQGTWYGKEIEKAASVYQPPELLEVALNRHLVEVNKIALDASPFSGKKCSPSIFVKMGYIQHRVDTVIQKHWKDNYRNRTVPGFQPQFPCRNLGG